jgi:hypothetical protein
VVSLILTAVLAASSPHLALVDASPLKVRGSGFHSHERVKVVATSNGSRHTRRVRASRTGRFVASFTPGSTRPCGALRVTATGKRGSHAALRGVRWPDCIVD